MQARLAQAANAGGASAAAGAKEGTSDTFGNIKVSLACNVALDILRTPYSKKFPGYEPYLMDEFDELILFEDLRSTQYKGRRLRDVFTFLKGGWASLADRDPAWLISTDEEAIKQRVFECLEFERAILPCQVANFALRALEGDAALAARTRYDHVLVDNFTELDLASQQLAQALAAQTFTLSANEAEGNPTFAEFPNFAGLASFLASNPKASVKKLAARGALEPEIHMGETMAHEMLTVAQTCKNALDAGQSVMLVAANKMWLKNARTNLERVGITVQKPFGAKFTKKFDDLQAAAGVAQAKARALAAHPNQPAPWRALLAIGNYTANSVSVEELRALALERGLAIDAALRELAQAGMPQLEAKGEYANSLKAAYARASDLVKQSQNAQNAEGVTSDTFDNQTNGVLVVSPKEALGRQADVVIFGAFVNGVIPCREYLDPAGLLGAAKERQRQTDTRYIDAIFGSARKKLLVTGFTSAPLEAAERLELKIDNIKLKAGQRICKISPSCYL
jgi:DNA helicase-2/ATP-dependent DNA helicase PcrA